MGEGAAQLGRLHDSLAARERRDAVVAFRQEMLRREGEIADVVFQRWLEETTYARTIARDPRFSIKAIRCAEQRIRSAASVLLSKFHVA